MFNYSVSDYRQRLKQINRKESPDNSKKLSMLPSSKSLQITIHDNQIPSIYQKNTIKKQSNNPPPNVTTIQKTHNQNASYHQSTLLQKNLPKSQNQNKNYPKNLQNLPKQKKISINHVEKINLTFRKNIKIKITIILQNWNNHHY